MNEEGPAPGSRFGNFEILAELGRGGMGCVYQARDLSLDRPVALKVLAEELARDASFIQRFTREARAAARLNHPSIVQIYEFGQVGSVYYLAMEYVDGYPVGAYLRAGHLFSEPEAISIVRHAARALGIAHAAGIVHRDVKPDNLMLSKKGEVKLVDLGLAKCLEEDSALTQAGYSMGSPHYVAPEQVRGRKDIDARADVYALGATLYHIASGKTPFDGSSGPMIMSQHLVEPLPDPRRHRPELSEGICAAIVRMMAKDREERFADMGTVDRELARLQQALAGGPAPTARPRPEPAPAPAPAPTRAPASTMASTRSAPAGTDAGTRSGPPAGWDEAVLRKVERELARHIGPLAKVLVKRAAKGTTSLDELVARLAENISEAPARKAFLDAVKRPG